MLVAEQHSRVSAVRFEKAHNPLDLAAGRRKRVLVAAHRIADPEHGSHLCGRPALARLYDVLLV
jgi:hypothetical protein